tara:strand:- start:23 stop:145 length:123 start_codon:yes stop_codon:yes gene_type:complete
MEVVITMYAIWFIGRLLGLIALVYAGKKFIDKREDKEWKS